MHVFSYCPITRAIWFGSRWNIRLGITCSENIKIVLEPPVPRDLNYWIGVTTRIIRRHLEKKMQQTRSHSSFTNH